jgi:hypothetical protein
MPDEIANELVSAGVAIRPFPTRGEGQDTVVHIIVDAINTGAATVAVASGINTCRRIAQAVIRRVRSSSQRIAKVQIEIDGQKFEHTVVLEDGAAEEDLTEFVNRAIGH